MTTFKRKHSIQDLLVIWSKELIFAAALLLVIAGAYFGYRWHTNNKNQAAHMLFAQNLEELERISQEGNKEDWESVETLFKLGYDQYPKSSLAPYFLIYQGQALLKQGKLDEARDIINLAVEKLPSDCPVLGLYKVKVALMGLDSKAQSTVDASLEQLQALAKNTELHVQDVAGYHLGLYYWVHNQMAKAQEVWLAMIEAVKTTEKTGQSPWAAKAQEMLASSFPETQQETA